MFFSHFYRPLFVKINNNVVNKRLFSTLYYKKQLFNTNLYTQCVNQNIHVTPLLTSIRFYAKGKDKKKEKGKKKIEINEAQLAEVINIDSLKTQMKKAVDTLKDDYIKNLSLRSTTGAIEGIPVNLDGKEYTLQELAQIVRKSPKTLILNLSTFPQAIPAVIKSLAKSGMNLSPQQDGTTLYIPIPKVTKEHRENLSKNAKTLFLKSKDHIRDAQLKFTKNVKNQENLATDLSHNVQEQITCLGDQYIEEAEKIMISKQSELLGKE